jgi:photosystem II stability/assembly factor-like uncharacterized protein
MKGIGDPINGRIRGLIPHFGSRVTVCALRLDASATSSAQNHLALNPRDPSLLLVAGRTYLHRSTDGGRTWTTNQNAFAHVPIPAGGLFDIESMAFDAQDPAVVYLASNLGGSIFRSKDGGWTWQRMPRSDAFYGFGGSAWLAADPVRGGQLVAVDQLGDVVATIDGGRTWAYVSHLPVFSTLLVGEITAMVTDPNNSRQVLVAESGEAVKELAACRREGSRPRIS